jgi:predicted nucleic acid-binding protein
MLTAISRTVGNTDIAISVVTLIELAHGAARADTAQRKAKRYQFIQELLMALPILCQSLFAWGRSTARIRRKECAFHSPIC